MNKLVSLLISIPLALVIIVFSLANRGPVTVDFWPLPATINMPLFALILAALMVGVLWGGMAAWLTAGRTRKRGRVMSRRADTAEMEVRHLEERISRLQHELKNTQVAVNNTTKTLPPPADAA